MTDYIETPKGKIVQLPNGKAELVWNTSFVPTWNKRYTLAQKFLDSEVLRGCEPYIPLLTGMLIKSGILGTDIGSGEVKWIAPYSRHQYYLPRIGTHSGVLRGGFWFERWKEVKGAKTIEAARKLAGGGS